MKKVLITISSFFKFCKNVLTRQKWIYFGETIEGDKFYCDIESINWITEDVVEIWEKRILGENSKMKQELISSLIKSGISPERTSEVYSDITLFRIDVKNKKWKMLYIIAHNKNGDEIYTADFHSVLYWEPIIPDTLMEILWEEICNFRKREILNKKRSGIKKRNPIAVFFLSMSGVYIFIWLAHTKNEMNSLGAQIPPAWWLFIPITNIVWLCNYLEGVEYIIQDKGFTKISFWLFFCFPPIGIALIQHKFNQIASSYRRNGLDGIILA
jgi:hypothetical protein